MTTQLYTIILDGNIIGITNLEKADAPMGVVLGNVTFNKIISGYEFFKAYCIINNIEIFADYPEDKLIATSHMPNMKILNSKGIEIKGQGTSISGMDSDVFEVTILGVPYPFYEEEFPHHVKAYDDHFKNYK